MQVLIGFISQDLTVEQFAEVSKSGLYRDEPGGGYISIDQNVEYSGLPNDLGLYVSARVEAQDVEAGYRYVQRKAQDMLRKLSEFRGFVLENQTEVQCEEDID